MVSISNSVISISINELGAQLSDISSKTRKWLWDGNPEIWPKHAPVLFPFVGRLPEGKYQYKGKEYSDVPIHGFAPYSTFECVQNTGSKCKMTMVVSEQVKKSYPFDFSFSVIYELVSNCIKITYEVINNSHNTMYYGIGSHPGFNVPMKDGLKFEDYYLEFPNAGTIRRYLMDEKCFCSGIVKDYDQANENRISLKHNLFDNDAVILENTGNKVLIKTDKDDAYVQVEYPDTKWCAIWHKVKMEVPFVCIEPWFSLPGFGSKNEISERSDFFGLEKGQVNLHHLNISVFD